MADALIVRDSTTSKYKNFSTSNLVKTGEGILRGFICSTTSSGTVQFIDGLTDNDDVADKATATLTSSGAISPGAHAKSRLTTTGACAPAKYAETVLTSSGVNVTEDDTVTIGSAGLARIYRFRDTLAQAYDVKIGASAAATLDNLKAAINATGTPGVEYFAGTLVHPTVIATTNGDTTQKIVARVIGTAANTEATTSTAATLTWADTTIGGGGAGSVAGVATTAATITIGSTVYTATTSLAEFHGLTAIPFQVLWETNEETFLDNLLVAINAGTGGGTKYGTGTTAHPTVVAFPTNNAAYQEVWARTIGTTANSIATTTTLGNYAWADTTLGGGTNDSDPGVATTAATVTIGGVTYTVCKELTETAGAVAVANQVWYNGSEANMLANLKLAIDAGATAGTNYSTGTVVHPTVEGSTVGATTLKVDAKTAGLAGNAITVSETMANTTWGAGVTTLSGGLEANVTIIETITPTAGTNYLFPNVVFENGLYIRKTNTIEGTVFYS